jgi:hypothetical protein
MRSFSEASRSRLAVRPRSENVLPADPIPTHGRFPTVISLGTMPGAEMPDAGEGGLCVCALLWVVGLWVGLALIVVLLLVLVSVGQSVVRKIFRTRRNGPAGAGGSSTPPH